MKRAFWPADKTIVTIPTEINGVEEGPRRWDTEGNPKEPEIVVHGSNPATVTVFVGDDRGGEATELYTDDKRGISYYYVEGRA
ncbi:hypothetical protein PN419_07660 [Halorubrum ezzemoulense]|uniref:hypothetical protein n=1 Tax=Halorubrum ezzemoulense TaxID=337243 RepID=UPI00232AE2FF|nr:hypothetical protein [Halorubrum ezzemoulense]MDB9248888.1 hypothetical protein [Halorubrum ezzemoulense]MDB9258774.1 hypothetical protein [Halorubrum ezzemoulense]MDB9262647.1 hypothetical protein [Halorubrum ezzemoulense]MDB9265793.1 hypothetical protein [Halorubrum ezzemoulense]MDB9269135.1 hypothetical protein [Halorubrum ezzemoulense]